MSDPRTLFVTSSLTVDGVYTTVVEYGDDIAVPLSRDEAVRYALAVMQACRYAQYDAAVWAQLAGEVKMERHLAAFAIKQLRRDRPALDTAATAPFGFEPVFSHVTGKPALLFALHGEKIGQLDPAAGLEHAMDVLIGSALADVDLVYLNFMRSTGLEEQFALSLVGKLRDFGAWQQGRIDD